MNHPKRIFKNIFFVLIISLLVRLVVAHFTLGGFDQQAWDTTATLVLQGRNPYIETKGIYSFAPLWMAIITALKYINISYIWPVILADLTITYLLYKKTKSLKIAYLYALNPITIYVTAMDGNFDPLMILFILLSYLNFNKSSSKSAIYFAISILFKQASILVLPAFLKHQKNFKNQLIYALIAVLPFFISLIPFILLDHNSIISNVFSYQPGGGWWGYDVVLRKISFGFSLWLESQARYVALGLMIYYYFFKKSNLLNDILWLFLGFFFLKPVGGAHYLLWILPFALLQVNIYFYLYSIFVSIYLLYGHLYNIFIPSLPGVGMISLPAWVTTGKWFIKTNKHVSRTLKF